ncbi:MAG: YgdI/YgdR family lipoprotein [Prevotella sp.]|nr:YgdI/YgdR family lipoprotein [Prevotella sp.]
MKKYIVSLVFAFSALLMLNGCMVSEDKLTEKVQQSIVEYEQAEGKQLQVTDLKLEKAEGKGYKGVLKGTIDGKEVIYDVDVVDEGSDFDLDWKLRE